MTPSDRVVAAADQPAGPAAGARVPGKYLTRHTVAADHAGRRSNPPAVAPPARRAEDAALSSARFATSKVTPAGRRRGADHEVR